MGSYVGIDLYRGGCSCGVAVPGAVAPGDGAAGPGFDHT